MLPAERHDERKARHDVRGAGVLGEVEGHRDPGEGVHAFEEAGGVPGGLGNEAEPEVDHDGPALRRARPGHEAVV